MNCCNDNGDCRQGRDCPVRTCRQRAGKPADYTDPIWIAKTPEEVEAELQRQWRRDLKSIVFIASCIVTFAIIVLVSSK
jgi:hypothetical protein